MWGFIFPPDNRSFYIKMFFFGSPLVSHDTGFVTRKVPKILCAFAGPSGAKS